MARKESTVRSPGTQRTPKGVTQGNILVDPITGDPICTKEDDDGQIRLCVDANISATVGDINVDLDFLTDGVHIGDKNTGNELKIEPDGSINVNSSLSSDEDSISISAHPNQVFAGNADSINITTFKEIFSYTSTDDKTRLMNVECTCGTGATFVIKFDGVIVRTRRSSSLERNVTFEFRENRKVASGVEVTVEAKIDALTANAPFDTFVSLEGYLI